MNYTACFSIYINLETDKPFEQAKETLIDIFHDITGHNIDYDICTITDENGKEIPF